MKLRSPITWYGGKYYMISTILPYFPMHHTYVEVFGGGASILLNKERSPVEIYNDINQNLTNLFTMIRDRGEELRQKLMLTPYSEVEFQRCQEPSDDSLEQARRDLFRYRTWFVGRDERSFGFSIHGSCGGLAQQVYKYVGYIEKELPKIISRLRTVEIMNRDAIWLIERWDSPATLFYCDPPYVASSRTPGIVYKNEMTDQQHQELLSVLKKCKGKIVLSGYKSDIYSKELSDWTVVEMSRGVHASNAAKVKRGVRTEVLWMNFNSTAFWG